MLLIPAIFIVTVTTIVGKCNWSMFCCALLYVHSSFVIILMGMRGLAIYFVCLPGVS